MHKFKRTGKNSFESASGWVILFDATRTKAWRMGRTLEGGLAFDSELTDTEINAALPILENLEEVA